MRPAAEWKPESRSRAMRDPIDQGISVLKRFRAEWRIWKTCSERLNTTPANSALSRWGRFTVDPGGVYIGKKPTMNYVLAGVTHLNGGARGVVGRARGRSIYRCADRAGGVLGRCLPDALMRAVRVPTEKVSTE